MSPFQGPYYVKVDPKNRINLPLKLRQASEDMLQVCYLSLGMNGCLYLLPRAEWQWVMKQFDGYSFADQSANFFMRYMMSNTIEVTPDKQSRILIPPKLAAQAGITDQKRDILILGMNRWIEIWETGRFEEYLNGYGQTFEEVAAKLLPRGPAQ
jgi:MraZ protein